MQSDQKGVQEMKLMCTMLIKALKPTHLYRKDSDRLPVSPHWPIRSLSHCAIAMTCPRIAISHHSALVKMLILAMLKKISAIIPF